MREKIRRIVIPLLLVFFIIMIPYGHSKDVPEALPNQGNVEEMRACWISYIDIQACLADKSEAAFRAKVHLMYDKIKANGLNTVLVHARAMGDAFYESQYFPYSVYLSKTRTLPSYDPYKILVELAHEKGLKFEAWINPYRISYDDETTMEFQNTPYYASYQNFLIRYEGERGTCLALNPQSEEARALIVKQAEELLSRYPVDGIHLDDYFYVDGMAPALPVEERKEAVNSLLRALYETIKKQNPECTFGISPAGNLDYARSQGADIDRWLSEDGYVDYVMPQIYWTDQYQSGNGTIAMFTERCEAWKNLQKNKTRLYVGLALYRAGEKSEEDVGWSMQSNNLAAQYACARGYGYAGFALFRYTFLLEEAAQEELANLREYLQTQTGVLLSEIEAKVAYSVHMQTYGWQNCKTDGVVAGSTKAKKQVEAIRIQLGTYAQTGGVMYMVQLENQSTSAWVENGEIAGTVGNAVPITGIRINLTGSISDTCDIFYRVYTENNHWSAWYKNGEQAGNEPIYALQLRIEER